jgi:hypothetical protein
MTQILPSYHAIYYVKENTNFCGLQECEVVFCRYQLLGGTYTSLQSNFNLKMV